MDSQRFAVIDTGGRQLRVSPGDIVSVDRLEAPAGETVTFDRVLLAGSEAGLRIGTPVIEGATVRGTVMREERGPKVIVFRKRKRHTFRKLRGHREYLTFVLIESIEA
ncbi:MAG: 50S ribosomal protein L21 [Acidobacteria bacterium]|nr:50S ribosomal protein L21 [Acidobacteriota bacterium]